MITNCKHTVLAVFPAHPYNNGNKCEWIFYECKT